MREINMVEAGEGMVKKRVFSLDALRGLDMLCIIGGEALVAAVAHSTGKHWAETMHVQMRHSNWAGFHFIDLIFPLFMFLSGVSIPLAILSRLEKGVQKRAVALKIVRRTVLLILLGIVYNGALQNFGTSPRIASVLGQIGIGYCIAAFVCMQSRGWRDVLLAFLVIALGVSVAQLWIPVPGGAAGVLTPSGSINSYLDRLLLPGRLYARTFDPEGVLCVISGAGVTLLGVMAGMLLRRQDVSGYRKVGLMAVGGFVLIAIALAAAPGYPVIKKMWTTTFVMLTGGISLAVFALFYLVIDVWGLARWSFPLRVIGMNAITIYLGTRFFNFMQPAHLLFGGVAGLCGKWEPVILCLGMIGIEWLLLYFLYRKKIFLKV